MQKLSPYSAIFSLVLLFLNFIRTLFKFEFEFESDINCDECLTAKDHFLQLLSICKQDS